MNKHPCYEFIVAWAEGRTVQFKNDSGIWYDLEPPRHVYTGPRWSYPPDRYRIKPEPRKVRIYEWAVDKHSPVKFMSLAHNEKHAADIESASTLIRWVSDWVELSD